MNTTEQWDQRPNGRETQAHSTQLTPIDNLARGLGATQKRLPAVVTADSYDANVSQQNPSTAQLIESIYRPRASSQERPYHDRYPPEPHDKADGVNGKERKTRGRPRLEVSGSTAADKRRTQIRVAQRKYRERKETTILDLKEEITELHELLQKTNSSVKQLYSTLDSTGLLDALPTDHAIQKQLKKLLDRADEITERLGEPRDDEAP